MGCEHSDNSTPSEIAAYYETEESLTLIDKFRTKTDDTLIVRPKNKMRSKDSTYNGLFQKINPSKISFSKQLEFRAYIPGWAFFIKTILLKIGTFSPYRIYIYGYCQSEWTLIIHYEQKEDNTTVNFTLFTEKSMKEGSINKLYSAIGVRMYAPNQDHFVVEKFHLFGQLLHNSCRISPEILSMPMGHKEESTDEGYDSDPHERNEKKLVEVCDKCRLTCLACKQDIDIINPGRRGYYCSACWKSEYNHICPLCGNKMDHKNPGRLCQECTEKSIGITECANCRKELPIS